MSTLENRITALEGTVKSNPPIRMAVDVAPGFLEILTPLGLEVPDALPGELFADWLERVSDEALAAILDYANKQKGESIKR